MEGSLSIAAETARPRAKARPISRIDRRAVRALLLSVMLIGVGWLAQGMLGRRLYVVEAGVLLLAAGALFARIAVRELVLPPLALPAVPLPAFVVDRKPHPGARLVGVALALNLAAIALLSWGWSLERANRLSSLPGGYSIPWLLYPIGVAVAAVGVYQLDARPSLRGVVRRNHAVLAALGVLLLVAALLRFYRLADQPYGLWFDEARDGLETLKIMADPTVRPVYAFFVDEPAMKLYATIPFFWVLGPTQLALRIPTALAGVAGVVGVYVLGRALFGRVVGLAAAGVIATMSWHVTFSRLAFNAVYSVALDAAAVGFLALGLQRGRRTYFALAGAALGLGLNFYYVSRVLIPVVGLYLAHRALVSRSTFLREHGANVAIFAIFVFLTASPLLAYAVEFPKEFNQRTANASIQTEIQQQHSYKPLFDNVQKHLLMFNVQGDPNGRHNLPGAPMLERMTAVLAVLGLLMALSRLRNTSYFVIALWWLFAMLGGILSLAFEAPQGLRSVDETAVTAVLAALPLAAVASLLGRIVGSRPVRLGSVLAPARVAFGGGLVGLVLVGIGVSNVQRYFVEQAGDFSSWNAHSTAATYIGQTIAAGRTVGRVYLDEPLMDQPSISFLAPSYKPQLKFDPVGTLPIRDAEGATIFLEGEQLRKLDMVRRMYPGAQVDQLRFQGGGPTVLYTVRVPPEQVASVEGVMARYWAGGQPNGEPLTTAKLPAIDGAVPSLPTPYYAEMKGTLVVPDYGGYTLRLEAPAAVKLRLDETELLAGGGETSIVLPRGNHALTVAGTVDTPTPIRLLWRPPNGGNLAPVPPSALFTDPVNSNGLLGTYYAGPSWSGQPALQQIDPTLQIRIHILPLPRPYTVEWKGKIYVPTDGPYRFGTESRDGSWLFVDERMIVDNGKGTGDYVEGSLTLTAGFHDIRIRFLDRTGNTFINTYWTPPGRAREPLPDQLLFPPRGVYPDKVALPPPPTAPVAQAPPTARPAPGAPPTAPAAAPQAPSQPVASRPGSAADTPGIAAEVVARIGEPGDGPGQFQQPRGVAFDKQGNLYVADTGNHRVQKFDPSGNPIGSWGSPTDLVEPLAIAVDSAGRVVVLDSGSSWIKRYTADGQLVDQFGGPDARFYHPRGMTVDAADDVWVADTGTSRVVEFNGKGEQIAVVGAKGKAPGQLGEPTGVAVDSTGGAWVADSANSKVVHFDRDGAPLSELPIGKSGSSDGPHTIALPQGGAVVTDPEAGKLILIGPDGGVRGRVDVDGLKRPVGIAIADDGRIAVGDVAQHQVVVLAPLPLR